MDARDRLIVSLHTLYAYLEQLRSMEGPDMLLPGSVEGYHSTVEDAYAAYGSIETTVDELGQQLEVEHRRLDQDVVQYGS